MASPEQPGADPASALFRSERRGIGFWWIASIVFHCGLFTAIFFFGALRSAFEPDKTQGADDVEVNANPDLVENVVDEIRDQQAPDFEEKLQELKDAEKELTEIDREKEKDFIDVSRDRAQGALEKMEAASQDVLAAQDAALKAQEQTNQAQAEAVNAQSAESGRAVADKLTASIAATKEAQQEATRAQERLGEVQASVDDLMSLVRSGTAAALNQSLVDAVAAQTEANNAQGKAEQSAAEATGNRSRVFDRVPQIAELQKGADAAAEAAAAAKEAADNARAGQQQAQDALGAAQQESEQIAQQAAEQTAQQKTQQAAEQQQAQKDRTAEQQAARMAAQQAQQAQQGAQLAQQAAQQAQQPGQPAEPQAAAQQAAQQAQQAAQQVQDVARQGAQQADQLAKQQAAERNAQQAAQQAAKQAQQEKTHAAQLAAQQAERARRSAEAHAKELAAAANAATARVQNAKAQLDQNKEQAAQSTAAAARDEQAANAAQQRARQLEQNVRLPSADDIKTALAGSQEGASEPAAAAAAGVAGEEAGGGVAGSGPADLESIYNEARKEETEITNTYKNVRATEFASIRNVPLSKAMELTEVAKPARPDLNSALLSGVVTDPTKVKAAEEEIQNAARQLDSMTALAQNMVELAGGKANVTHTVDSLNAQAAHSSEMEAMAMQDEGAKAKDLTGAMSQGGGDGGKQGSHGGNNPPGQSGSPPGPAGPVSPVISPNHRYKPIPGRILTVGEVSAEGSRNPKWMYIDSWYVIGPWPNPNRENLNTKFPPESVIDLDASYAGRDGKPLRWKFYQSPDEENIVVPYLQIEYIVYYAYTEVYLDEAADLWIAVGSDDQSKVWINDELVWKSSDILKGWTADEGFRKVHFQKGRNRILSRVENGWHDTSFSMMICTDTGT